MYLSVTCNATGKLVDNEILGRSPFKEILEGEPTRQKSLIPLLRQVRHPNSIISVANSFLLKNVKNKPE